MEEMPAEGATVDVGASVTLAAGELGGTVPTFEITSSPALISTPDIDRGVGSPQAPGWYAFTSTKATTAPRTIDWAATYTFTPGECEHPMTFTTPVRTLAVVLPLAVPAPEPQPQSSPPPHPARCDVPRLIGDSLAKARRVLRRNHCALGAVSKHGRDRGERVITGQSIPAGRKQSLGTRVAVDLGPRTQRSSKKR